ncbi:thiol-disulfide oxidoreductase DCC family protein [Litorimonas sp. RW-G-Af-16]|uniref:thiol-disulfide oxidoreductase DCC family protein n=1 Tax=Litorimonas sp. RW-G-Af-16 TaxID=3241168 RepID=UPI00390C8430
MTTAPDIEVFYDGGCPICVWEVDLYGRMDRVDAIRWINIDTLADADLPLGKTREDLLGRFHVRDLTHGDEADWHIGVDAFARIWRSLPKLRHLAWLFSVPGLRQITKLAYKLFLRWQSWHRKHRRGNASV